MIITENVFVKLTNRNKNFYESKGYNINDTQQLLVNVNDLPDGSHSIIMVKCVNCQIEKEVVYKNYIIQIKRGGEYYCSSCKHIKTKKNNLLKYGVESPLLLPEQQIKMKQKLFEKHGVINALESDVIISKMVNKLKKTYNVINVSQLDDIKKKKIVTLSKTWLIRLNKNNPDIEIISGDYDKQLINIKCDCGKKHNFEISYDLYQNRREFNSILCTKCNKIGRSVFNVENKIINFISEYYDGEIIKNDRKTIKPYEIDIYLPEFNIAIELNGLKWHNEVYKDKNYHLMKYNLCKDKNIKLIQFFEDEWVYKYDIVKSMILNKIGKTENKIYGRKCVFKEINYLDCKKFLNHNHIQGHTPSKYNYGLIYDNQIVSLLTLGNRKISGENVFELIRYCTKLNTNVLGGFSKLFKHALKELNFDKIITYANKSYSTGDLYEKNGFKYMYDTKPNYYYIFSKIRRNRYSYRKDILVKQGYDINKTEKQIMKDRGILRIYDSGNKKYIWEKEV